MINILTGVQSTAAALSAERIRMDVVSQNLSLANATHGLEAGKPYQRQQVVFETVLGKAVQGGLGGTGAQPLMVNVARIQTDSRMPRAVYRPDHPDADAKGMVLMPDINVHEEMVDLITASRSFEANLAALKTARSMAMATLSLGKR